ncbi:MAG: endopeptidase La [Erysipelotrichaceae bacterium]|nr:endopeptidase La [Erysipelotrichaceae bacterium]
MPKEKFIPLICTRDIIVFPEQEVSIEVGRPKTIKAVDEANINSDGYVVVVCQKEFQVDEPGFDDIYNVGTLCLIKTIRRKNNALTIVVKGIERVVVDGFADNGDYLSVKYHDLKVEIDDEKEVKALILRINNEIIEHSINRIDPINLARIAKLDDGNLYADTIAQFGITFYIKQQELLETTNVNDRLLKILEAFIGYHEIDIIEAEIDKKMKARFDDNQKEYLLKEKMRLIKEELNEDADSDIDKLSKAFESEPFPDYVKKKARDEIKRFEMTPAASGESSVIRNYLDWLYQIPWYQKSKDNEDLNLATEILDEDHYGLIKVKERIMEYLAVKNMTNSLKSPILCLVGPPGVGKTSLAKSVARALDRKFVKQSLGGVKDESEIRGHRRTYLGSMPGRIIQGMKKAGTLNPVFLIDEIDKMASDFKGDPSSAMLEVLDPEQNNAFSDNYMEEPYDLSDVLFIATANYIENIPPALKDRLEIIELSSYTEIEKVKIAQKHLIPKQLSFNGLKSNQLIFDKNILLYLIRHYTREAGVRNLERIIATICRKTVLAILKDRKKSFKLTKALIVKWLGNEKFEYGEKNRKDQVGVVTGLAYTSFGGDILPIEVTYFDGKGKMIVTGQLGDVMKESTSIAMDWVKANADKLKIDSKWFESHDIHIHAPEGAVPKDGPSAGITLTSAIVSCITNRKVNKDIAMTGEVTLRGNVLPIGGLKEKSLAAHRSGIKKIIFPKGNVKDLDEIAKEVKESIEFIPVAHVSEVLKVILL